MKALALILLVSSGCSLYAGHGDDLADDDCGPRPDGAGVCTCSFGTWRCDSCGGPPRAEDTCTPGEQCSYEDWEHGCSCACDEDGRWGCFNETIGSTCTTGEYTSFSSPFPVAAINTPLDEVAPALSRDGNELMFVRRGPAGDRDLWRTTRPGAFDDFAVAVRDASASTTPADEGDPSLSSDGLVLYFTRADVVMEARRAGTGAPWAAAVAVPELAGYTGADFSRADLAVVAASRTASPDLFELTRPTTTAPWSAARRIDELADPAIDRAPCMREDGHELIFEATRGGKRALFVATRTARDQPWQPAAPLFVGGMDNANLGDPELSADGLTLYFVSDVSGNADVYVMTRERH